MPSKYRSSARLEYGSLRREAAMERLLRDGVIYDDDFKPLSLAALGADFLALLEKASWYYAGEDAGYERFNCWTQIQSGPFQGVYNFTGPLIKEQIARLKSRAEARQLDQIALGSTPLSQKGGRQRSL